MIGEAVHVRTVDVATPAVTIAGRDPVTIPLTEPVVVIGRDPGCGVVLDDITVSRRHAELRRDADLVTLADLGSLNGTFVNRSPVDNAVLHDGDTIWIGEHRMIFRWIRAADGSCLPRPRSRERMTASLRTGDTGISSHDLCPANGGASSWTRVSQSTAREVRRYQLTS